MASTGLLKIEVRLAWWWNVYAQSVLFVALTFNLEPDWGKVINTAARAIRFRFEGGRRWHRLVD